VNLYPFIEAERAEQSTAVQRQAGVRAAGGLPCRLLHPSAATPSARQRTDDELTRHIRAAHQASQGRYGAPRIHAQLRP
jgi:hypothetical protein